MPEATKIEWCDHSASPWHGCSKVHAGCDHCYAEAMSKRNPGTLGVWGDGGVRVKSKSFIAALERFNRIGEQEQRVQSVFPSLCDPFEDRPELRPWRREMFETIDRLPWVRLLLLTKRPENIRRLWPANQNDGDGNRDYSPRVAEGMIHSGLRMENVWLGCSVSDQETADTQIPELLTCRDLSPVLFVSAEPLLGPVDLGLSVATCDCCSRWPSRWICLPRDVHGDWPISHTIKATKGIYRASSNSHGALSVTATDGSTLGIRPHEMAPLGSIDWLIAGGESGPQSRPCDIEWLHSIRDQCQAAGVPVFVKQLGSRPVLNAPVLDEWPDHVIWRADKSQQGFRVHGLIHRKGGDAAEWPEDLRVREFPQPEAVAHA